ncbi:MAG: GNAT family N-acetyltransferase [Oscillospiraceae bacterium]|nr:GNAT family N-acetyltransferase [Oscillospiraceae bacterium]
MIKIISDINELINYKNIIDNLYSKNGNVYLQSYASIEATFKSNKTRECIIVFDTDKEIILSFKKKTNSIWTSVFEAYSILCDTSSFDEKYIVNLLEYIKQEINIKTLYFPLIYEDDLVFILANDNNKFNVWQRLPTCIIDGQLSADEIIQRSLIKDGSILIRQRKAFENKLFVQEVKEVENKKAILKQIELKSWKSKCGQDMLSRENQYEYYSKLLESEFAKLIVAFDRDNEEPISYRIDLVVNDKIVYVVKSSYNDEYKKYSPGSYLLTYDLTNRYSQKEYKYIDLYGAPNTLKDMVATGKIQRYDICFSDCENDIEEIKKDRLAYDVTFNENYTKKKSIRNIYM